MALINLIKEKKRKEKKRKEKKIKKKEELIPYVSSRYNEGCF